MNRRYYNPGEAPAPAKPEFPVRGSRQVKSRRMPRAKRLALMAAHGISRPTGRQWRLLRKRLAREGRS